MLARAYGPSPAAWRTARTALFLDAALSNASLHGLLHALTPPVTRVWRACGSLSAPRRNALFALFLCGILAYGGLFAAYMLDRFDVVNLIEHVNLDDSFYYFQIARNLADGKFSTFDGGLSHTNGYHPLWMLLITPFYWAFDPQTALFAIKAFEILLLAAGAALVAAAARLAHLPWILLFAVLPELCRNWYLFRGMESAAALFMLGLLFLGLGLYARNPARWKRPLAAVLFALPWVRLEYMAVSLAAAGALFLMGQSSRKSPGGGWKGTFRSLSAAAAPLLGAAAGILAYFTYNGIVFGGIVPVSGAAKRAKSQLLWEQEGGYSLARNFQGVLEIPYFNDELLVALEVCIYFLLAWRFAARSADRQERLQWAFLAGVFCLAAEHLAKFAQTVLSVHPEQGGFDWYFAPAYLMMALIVPVRCYAAIFCVRRLIGPRSRSAAGALSLCVVAAGAAALFPKAGFALPFQYVDRADQFSRYRYSMSFYMGALTANRVLPEGSVIASYDAGVIGYFSRFPVVNLDGLVNSYDYLRMTGEEQNERLRRVGVTHYADAGVYPQDALFEVGPLAPGSYRLRFGPFMPLQDGDASAWFWERMEPHFDYRADNVGIVVDGRVAQAFARDCAEDPFRDEVLVFSWGDGRDETFAWSPRMSAAKNGTVFCASGTVLPREAVSPARIETMPPGDYLQRLVGGSLPIIRSEWDVYARGNKLVYFKEQCGWDDMDARFFLHVLPVDAQALPVPRRRHGFHNLDFNFEEYVRARGGTCAVVRTLPEYPVSGIRTGQSISGQGKVWEAEFRFADSGSSRSSTDADLAVRPAALP